MKIKILAFFCGPLDGTYNSRFLYLGDLLDSHEAEVITTDFNHYGKCFYPQAVEEHNYPITRIHEPSYKKNISLSRFYSHFVWARNIKKYLKTIEKPDLIYIAVPTLLAAYYAERYCEKNGITSVIDVQDLWPEAFKMVFDIPVISNIVFMPFNCLANSVYKKADRIVSVSETYTKRALSGRNKPNRTVFLGTDLETFDSNVRQNVNTILFDLSLTKPSDEIWVGYCGSLGDSYDLDCVIDALSILKDDERLKIKLIVMGDGYKRESFIRHSEEKKISHIFTGNLPYAKMCALLSLCDIAVNPIVGKSAASIINKHADYASAGIPVINTQESAEYRDLVESYNMGFNTPNGDPAAMAGMLKLLACDENRRISMGRNARRCAEDKFDRRRTYTTIVDLIEDNAGKQ